MSALPPVFYAALVLANGAGVLKVRFVGFVEKSL